MSIYENGLEISQELLYSYFKQVLVNLNQMSYNNIPIMSTGQVLGVGYSYYSFVVEEMMSTTTEQYFISYNTPQYTENIFDNTRYRLTENYLQKWYEEIEDINNK